MQSEERASTQPLAYGYVAVTPDGGCDVEMAAARWQGWLADVARVEGFALAGIFADALGRTEDGLYALMDAVARGGAVAVIVPRIEHLWHVGALSGTDAAGASRHLRARVVLGLGARSLSDAVVDLRDARGVRVGVL